MLSEAPKVISLFAGCGGSSLGYKLADCQVLAAIENDPHAANIYRENHPRTQLLEADITTLDASALMNDLNLQEGELDILDGSPPCQGFSSAGKRDVDDPRNKLFEEYLRFLSVFKPKAFVMENVTGLYTGKMRPVFIEIIQKLREQGYTVQAKVLNASHYGVAQSRNRLIILGLRSDLERTPTYPEPVILPVTLREALKNLNEPGLFAVPVGQALHIGQALRAGESGATLHKRYGHKGNDFQLIRLDWDKPAKTVCKTIRPGQCGLLHPDEMRYLGINELKRICSFPDDYHLEGSFEEQWARLGNAVPPLLMKAVAESLVQQLRENT